MDAGTPDAGAPDAGAPDAGSTAVSFPLVISLTPAGLPGDLPSTQAAASETGRFVAFQSQATTLIASDANSGHLGVSDVYVRDTCAGAHVGCQPATSLVSVNEAGAQCTGSALNGSIFTTISGDGRFVLFRTDTCYAGSTGNTPQIALRDTCAAESGPVSGCTPSTRLITVNTSGQISQGRNQIATISRNGRYVVWTSDASDVVPGYLTHGVLQVYLRDTCNGAPGASCTPHTIAVSTSDGSGAANGDSGFEIPVVSNGGIVAFESVASNLIGNPALASGTQFVIYRADCSAGVSPCALSIISVLPGSGTSVDGTLISSEAPAITPDGRFIAFLSQGEDGFGNVLATTLPPNFPSPNVSLIPKQMMLYDSCSGTSCVPSFTYVTVDGSGNLDLRQGRTILRATLSDDGRFVSFISSMNLAPAYPGSTSSAYVRDTCNGAPSSCVPGTTLVSVDKSGVAAGAVSISNISGDGHVVVFDSFAQSPANTSMALPIGQVLEVRNPH